MTNLTVEREVLENLKPELEAEGYKVFIRPGRGIVPPFLGAFEPDAVALGSDKNLLIEVVSGGESAAKRLQTLGNLMKGIEGWELRVEYIQISNHQDHLAVQSSEQIAKSINEINSLVTSAHMGAALLLAWATFEATARFLMAQHFHRPQTPKRLINVLAEQGYVDPDQADILRALAIKRNELVHGQLHVAVTAREMSEFVAILEQLLTPPGE